jgi:nucleoside-diphosphate-sugar epimerase
MGVRRVLVIGGTGFLGRRIAQQFVANGDQVAVLSRGSRDSGDAAEQIHVDRDDTAAFARALRGRTFDVVVDNIAFDASDVQSSIDVLRGSVGHYLLTSSAAVYTNLQGRRPLRESEADLHVRLDDDVPDPFHPRLKQAYGNGKRAAEQALLNSGMTDWTVLRPPVIIAADDRTQRIWWLVQRILDGGPVVVPDWGPGRMFQVAWADDVARAFVCASLDATASGRVYNVAQAEIFTAASWVAAFATALGREPNCVSIDERRLAVSGLAGYTMPIAGRPLGHVLLDCGDIRHDLGFAPTPDSTWLVDTAHGCAADPPERPSMGYDRRDDEVRAARAVAGD